MTVAQIDAARVASCTHYQLGLFRVFTAEEAADTLCDFSNKPRTASVKHPAFDGPGDNSFVSNRCLAVMCKDCYDGGE